MLGLVNISCSPQLSFRDNGFFYYPSKQIFPAPHTTANIQWLTLYSTSGNKLAAQYWQQPEGLAKGLVVHFHGNAGNLSDTREKVDWLVDEGWELLLFDYSGYGLSEGRPSPLALREDGITALRKATELVKVQRRSHPEYQYVAIGTSMGGAVLTDTLAHTQGKTLTPQLLVIDSSFASYLEISRHVVTQTRLGRAFQWLISSFISDKTAPIHAIAHLDQVPKLYVHCQEDQLIPEHMSRALYQRAGGAKNYWSLPDCGHARSFTRDFPHYQQALKQVIQAPSIVGTELASSPLLLNGPLALNQLSSQ